ncbi:MAG TPA: L-threonylcarbamoyladenylate synthase [Steroidobacteraceae bacterium]|nr:L-threonylcarbamoyladenylate synthase [Steroidobacteraceae bacterium]
MVKVVRASQAEIEAAVDALRDGELVAFPTETVYGLGANASNPAAVRKVYELKGRPPSHPVIVHIDQAKYLRRWVRELTPAAEKLAAAFWPGPLTLVLPRGENVQDVVTGGQDSVAIRIPSHPMARQLLDAFGGGIAAPSANRYGRLSATRAEHVEDEFGDAVKVVLDGGECQVGLESTIVSCLDDSVRLLRPGAVTLSQLRGVVGEVQIGADKSSPRVPGSAPAHYAPATPLTIVPGGEIDALAESLSEGGQRIAVLAQRLPLKTYQYVTWINAGKRAEAFGHDLYANLRTLDKAGCARILVQEVPGDERWDAVRDRLARGAVGAAADSGRYSALGTGVLP